MLFKKKNHPIFALFITRDALQIYDITNNQSITEYVHSDNHAFAMYFLAQLINDYCIRNKLDTPVLICNPIPHTEIVCDSTYTMDQHHTFVHRAMILPSCFKWYVSFLKPEIVFQYHLLANFTGSNEVIITSSTALYLYFLQTIGKVPPENCMNIADLHSWIEDACSSIHDTSTILFKAIKHLGYAYADY